MIACFAQRTKGWALLPDASAIKQYGMSREKTYMLSEDELYVFSMCDGNHDFSSLAFLPRHRAALKHLLQLGAVWLCPKGFVFDAPMIQSVLWSVTGKCNMKCRHCYMSAPDGQSELSFAAMERIADELCVGGVSHVQFTGGEPLIRRDLFALYDCLAEQGISLSAIYTNATLVNDRFLKRIREAGISPRFFVSFDGIGTHDAMRGISGAQEMTLCGIRSLVDGGYKVTVTTTVDEVTLQSLDATYEVMHSLGVDAWGMARPLAAGCGKSLSRVDDQRLADECEKILAKWQRDGEPFTLALEAFFSQTVPPKPPSEKPAFSSQRFACECCQTRLYISQEGVLMPCACYEDTEYNGQFPNLTKVRWAEAWGNPTLQHIRGITVADVLADNPGCATCKYLHECNMGCRMNATLAGNGLTGRDEMVCGLLQSGLKAHFTSIAGKKKSNRSRSRIFSTYLC
jgi:Fe-coproporphyrin III synthase